MAACPIQIEFDGRLYWDTGANSIVYDSWAVSDRDLEAIGQVTRATVGRGFLDATVYRIRGIDPREAIAMHDGRLSGIGIFVIDANRFPTALCARITIPLSYPAACPSTSTSP